MKAICLHDKGEIESFLRRNTFLHLYALGDLDDFFWQYTTWYALKQDGEIKQLALVYMGTSTPILLGLTEESEVETMRELLRAIQSFLPTYTYGHFSNEAVDAFAPYYWIQSVGIHYKMALTDVSRLQSVDTVDTAVIPLSQRDLNDLQFLYWVSYPDNAFDPRMLETGQFYGVRRGGELVCAAGIHVYSPQYRVAAIGNVVIREDFRNRGLATAVCARLCKSLLENVDHVGLNVKADNTAAIACYENLGFERVARYEEYWLKTAHRYIDN